MVREPKTQGVVIFFFCLLPVNKLVLLGSMALTPTTLECLCFFTFSGVEPMHFLKAPIHSSGGRGDIIYLQGIVLGKCFEDRSCLESNKQC